MNNSPRVSTTNATRKNNFRFQTNKNNDPRPLTKNTNKNKNKKPKVRRGAITYKNAQGIRGQFQKPPRPPSKAVNVRPPSPPMDFGGPIYANNNNSNEDPRNPTFNYASLSASQMDAYIRRLRLE